MKKRAPHLEFLVLTATSLVLWWRALSSTFSLALSSDAHTHILLILPLSIALIYLRRHALQPVFERSLRAAALLIASLLIAGLGKWGPDGLPNDVRLALSMFGLVTWWIGSVVFCFGTRSLRVLLFPLCFLFLLIPIPELVVNGIIEFLQQQSTIAARIMFRSAGVPVTQDGIMLSIPGLDIEVAHECSSIRSSLMLVVTTMVLADLFLRSWWRKALLIAVAVPLSIAKNGFRIFTIAELGTRVDPGFLDGRLHHRGGLVFFGLSVVVVSALLWILRRTEFPRPVARSVAV